MSSPTAVPAAVYASPSPGTANLAPPARAEAADPRVKDAAAAALAAAAFDKKEGAAAPQTFFEDRGLRVVIIATSTAEGDLGDGFDWNTEMQKALPVTVKVSKPVFPNKTTYLKTPLVPNTRSTVVYKDVSHEQYGVFPAPSLIGYYISDKSTFFETEDIPGGTLAPSEEHEQIDVEITGVEPRNGNYGVMIKGPDNAISIQCWTPTKDYNEIDVTVCSPNKFVIHGFRKTEFTVQPILSGLTFTTDKKSDKKRDFLSKDQCLVTKKIRIFRGRAYRFKISLDEANTKADAAQANPAHA